VYETSKKIILFLSKEYLDRNINFFPIFHSQYTPDFFCFVAEHYGLRNTASWWTKDLASDKKYFENNRFHNINSQCMMFLLHDSMGIDPGIPHSDLIFEMLRITPNPFLIFFVPRHYTQ
jgi:hypothetical protein